MLAAHSASVGTAQVPMTQQQRAAQPAVGVADPASVGADFLSIPDRAAAIENLKAYSGVGCGSCS